MPSPMLTSGHEEVEQEPLVPSPLLPSGHDEEEQESLVPSPLLTSVYYEVQQEPLVPSPVLTSRPEELTRGANLALWRCMQLHNFFLLRQRLEMQHRRAVLW